MRSAILLGALACLSLWSPAFAKGGHGGGHSSYGLTGFHSVRGYVTKNGTYVAPHYQTNPNWTKNDNWSTRGNVNPFTGAAGTKPGDGGGWGYGTGAPSSSYVLPPAGANPPVLDETFPAYQRQINAAAAAPH